MPPNAEDRRGAALTPAEESFRSRWPSGRSEDAPPSPIFLAQDDVLILRGRYLSNPNPLAIRARVMRVTGEVVPFVFAANPTIDGSVQTSVFDMTEGYLLSAVVEPATMGADVRGLIYVTLGVGRRIPGGADIYHPLVSDLLARSHLLGWPGGRLASSIEGPAVNRVLSGTDPAAGVEVSETFATLERAHLRSLVVQLVTNATVANRRVSFVVDDGAAVFYRVDASADQAASLTRQYCLAEEASPSAFGLTVFTLPLPIGLHLLPGYRVRTITTNLQAGDDFGAPVYCFERWVA